MTSPRLFLRVKSSALCLARPECPALLVAMPITDISRNPRRSDLSLSPRRRASQQGCIQVTHPRVFIKMLQTPPLGALGSFCRDERVPMISAGAAVPRHHSGTGDRDRPAEVPRVTVMQVRRPPGASGLCCSVDGAAVTVQHEHVLVYKTPAT